MTDIGIIAPYREIYYEAQDIKKELSYEIDIRIGLLSHAIGIAKDMVKNGAQVLISRGGTLNYIRKEFPKIPLVEIEISSYDIAAAILTANKISSKVALIIFDNMLYENRDLSKLFNVDLKIFHIKKEEQALDAIKQAAQEGYEVMVGGGIAKKISEQMGIHSVLISSGKDSICRAIRQAQKILHYRKDVLKQMELIETVIENTPIGIITTDRSGRIKMINTPALEMLKQPREYVLGNNVYKIYPELKGGKAKEFVKEFNRSKFMVNSKPLNILSSNIGYIITIEEITTINKKEKFIRSVFTKKGHIARYNFDDIIGKSASIKECVKIAKRYAKFNSTVVICGETGTGKEVFAQSIHNSSKRSNGPFVAVNCASFSESLLESELFGYVEGAFTGASKSGKAGLFEMAHKGTVFLDEISEMPLAIQAKLLRVIQEKSVMRLGDDKVIPVDVRIIAASNKNLYEMVKTKKFREDLYYRLNVLTLTIPPLRERPEDIILLFEYFLDLYSLKFNIQKPIIDKKGLEKIKNYKWPGNIRELENFVKRLLAASATQYIDENKIISLLNINKNTNNNAGRITVKPKKLTKEQILKALEQNDFNKTKTAQQLGVSRTTLWRILKKRDIVT